MAQAVTIVCELEPSLDVEKVVRVHEDSPDIKVEFADLDYSTRRFTYAGRRR